MIALKTTVADDLWPAKLDEDQLAVILNIVINARDAIPEDGQLTIATANALSDEDLIRFVGGLAPGR